MDRPVVDAVLLGDAALAVQRLLERLRVAPQLPPAHAARRLVDHALMSDRIFEAEVPRLRRREELLPLLRLKVAGSARRRHLLGALRDAAAHAPRDAAPARLDAGLREPAQRVLGRVRKFLRQLAVGPQVRPRRSDAVRHQPARRVLDVVGQRDAALRLEHRRRARRDVGDEALDRGLRHGSEERRGAR